MADFIANNYIWLIIVGVVIIMAVIGYFADKSGYGASEINKRMKEPKPKKVKMEKEVEEEPKVIEIPNKPIDEIINEQASTKEELPADEMPIEITDEMVSATNEEETSIEESTEVAEEVSEVETPDTAIEPMEEDLYAPLGTTPIEETKENDNVEIPEELYEPISNDAPVEEPVETPVEEAVEPETNVVSEWTDAPVVEPQEEEPTVAEDDDIWKF